jgi:hypothetical protein
MKWRCPLALIVVCVFLALPLVTTDAAAQSLLEFDRWMQKIEKRSLSMQRNLKRKDAQAAREIQDLYRRMEQFFAARDSSGSAVRLSTQGVELADSVVGAATNDDYEAALKSAITLARACRDCHTEYKPLD